MILGCKSTEGARAFVVTRADVWSQIMNGARPRAECRVIRVRSWCEYVWAAIGLFVRWDAAVHVSVVASREGVVWMVVDGDVRTLAQGRQMSTQQGNLAVHLEARTVHNPASSARNFICFSHASSLSAPA